MTVAKSAESMHHLLSAKYTVMLCSIVTVYSLSLQIFNVKVTFS